MAPFRAGIDIGGTFADTVIVDSCGELSFVKVPSTPPGRSFERIEMSALRS